MEKQQAIDELKREFERLLGAVNGLDEDTMSERFYDGWGVKDILAHISGWQHQMTAALERMARGEKPVPEGVDYSNPDEWNARFAAAMAPQNGTTVVADLRQSFANFVRAARDVPGDRYGEGKTANRILDTNGYGHYREHLPAIEEFKASRAK
jgi:hypothetical protein